MKQLSRKRLSWRHPDLLFWLCFIALNAILFLPTFLLNWPETDRIRLDGSLLRHPLHTLFEVFLWRDYPDPFRVNLELPILLALWVNVAWIRRGLYRLLVMAVYFVTLVYYLYESVMLSIYRVDPVFYNHYFLIKDGLAFLLDHLNLPASVYLLAALAVVAAVAAVVWAMRVLVDWKIPDQLSRGSRIFLGGLAAAVCLSAVTYRTVLADPRMVVSSVTFKLEKNITASLALYHNITSFDDSEAREAYDYRGFHLARKPNIYLIFVESYGSVLYKRPDWREAYLKLLDEMGATLTKDGFHMASALSTSPTWGGGSWLAYTSALFGLRIDTHPQYLSFLDRYQAEAPRYPDLGAYLRGQGYYYLWVTSLAVELKDSQWEQYKTFYGVDRWLRYRDLHYNGLHYGWGPAPPDQYVLGYARDVALKDVDQPLLLFYITQNSHYPWLPLPEIADSWEAINVASDAGDPVAEEVTDHQVRRQNYLDAIHYQLDMLTGFMQQHAGEDAIFVLVGDHQPPRVSRRADTYDTPVHIVSRDAKFIANLRPYGLEPGLVVADETAALRHEGLYSLLVRALVQTYGETPSHLPAYLPAGVVPPDWISAESGESATH